MRHSGEERDELEAEMTVAELVVLFLGLMVGVGVGILITPRPARLKPCKKCGNCYPGLIAQSKVDDAVTEERYWVVCLMCDEESEDCETEEEAIREWNRK